MPWASSIRNERQRRLVIAIIMAVLLAASVGAAGWISATRAGAGAPRDPMLESAREGVFTLLRPGGWEPVDAADLDAGEHLRELNQWRERTNPGRSLSLLELRHEDALPPAVAVDLVTQSGGEPVSRPLAVRSQHMVGILVEGPAVARQGQRVARLLAVLTLDGERHAVLMLERPGALQPYDYKLMLQIAGSLDDTRYKRLDTDRLMLASGNSLPVPPHLIAVRRDAPADPPPGEPGADAQAEPDAAQAREAEPRILLIPAEKPSFFFLEPHMVQLQPIEYDATELRTGSGDPLTGSADADRPTASPPDDGDAADEPTGDPVEALSVSQRRLAMSLAHHYAQVTGQDPPPRSVFPLSVAGQDAFTVALPDEKVGSRSVVWAVQLAGDRAIFIRLTADPLSARLAQEAARRFVAAIEPE